jgi:UDP-N-acetylmuramate--alanine ligase
MNEAKAGQSSWQERLAAADPSLRVHLVGIGGAGLSAIAQVLIELGMRVSGSDRQVSDAAARLAAQGATIYAQQRAANLTDLPPDERPDLALISSAVDASNPERQAAETLGIPLVKRDQFLPALLARRAVIAVAGSHGKSTTTAMIVKTLRESGVDAGYIIGAHLPGFGSGSAGSAPTFVIEADEYDHMFLGLQPTVAVITNVEWDHPDCYPTPASFRRAFMRFVDRVQRDGLVISCADDAGAEQVRLYGASRGPQWLTYGTSQHANLQAVNVMSIAGGGSTADLFLQGVALGKLTLTTPGLHNVRNGLAALAAASWRGIPASQALASLTSYAGVGRRFELKGEVKGVTVIDDYAHHPTEIGATLAAARRRFPERRIWAIFQPHTFSRTRALLQEMAACFGDADRVIVTDIFAAREHDDGAVSGLNLVAASNHPQMVYLADLSKVACLLIELVRPGDVVITLGAGDGYKVGEWLLEGLSQ